MNILLLGNGFDLAHELPTRYDDFLNFLKFINKENKVIQFKENVIDVINNMNNLERNEIILLSKDNIWYKYFRRLALSGNKWCDFEEEIAFIVEKLEALKRDIDISREYLYIFKDNYFNRFIKIALNSFVKNNCDCTFTIIRSYCKEMSIKIEQGVIFTLNKKFARKSLSYQLTNHEEIKLSFEEFIKYIINDLERFCRCFELYLRNIVEKLAIKKLDYVEKIVYSENLKILTFNYTHTYRKYLGLNTSLEVSHIHGDVGGETSNENNNPIGGSKDYSINHLVLGIDGGNRSRNRNEEPLFADFRKYFQILKKASDVTYSKWFESRKGIENLYVIGHSLNLSDKKILKEIFTIPNINIQIFCRSEKERLDRMRNLSIIVGEDIFTKLNRNGKITFKEMTKERIKETINGR